MATGLALGVTGGGLAAGAIADSLDPDASSPVTIAVLSASFVVFAAGPSAGHWYAGERGHALRWTAIRGAGIAAALGGLYLAFDAYDDDRALVPGVLLAGAGAAALTVGVGWSLYDAHRAARRARARGAGAPPAIGLIPYPGGGGALVVLGRF